MNATIWTVGVPAAAVLLGLILLRFSGMIRYIPNNRVGILEKVISLRGSLRTGFIALGGETGFQPHVLRGGWHLFFPFQYRVHTTSLVTIPQGKIGYIFARDGQPLQPMQTLAENVTASDFQDAAGFLRAAGQRGRQLQVEAEAEKAARVGIAQAIAVEEQVRAYGGPQFQVTQQVMARFAEAIERAGVDVVPKIVMGQQAGAGGSNVLETLLAMRLSDKLGAQVTSSQAATPEMEALKKEMRQSLMGTMTMSGPARPA